MMAAVVDADLRAEPFPHTTHPSALAAPLCEAALEWMESTAPWKLRTASFYEQWELHLKPGLLPSNVRALLADETVERLCASMMTPLTPANLRLTEVTAHKLALGQTIRIHNDYLEGGETHRLLIQLNRGWQDEQGGLLMFFGSAAASDVRRVLRPVHGSATAFAISPGSFHAVSTILRGDRFTLVYSFQDSGEM